MEDEKRVIYRPELVLEYRLAVNQKGSKLSVNTADDALRILDGIKQLSDEHLVLIYLDAQGVVAGVDTFLCGIDAFDVTQSSRALANAIQKQNREPSLKVIIAQTIPERKHLVAAVAYLEGLRVFSIRLAALQIELVDFILLSYDTVFSLRRDANAWKAHQGSIKKLEEIFLNDEILQWFDKGFSGKETNSNND
ncbi:MAG: hypothetical protein GKR94_04370 [Gammaproteobacteria bacterium]|nr:hypothetical protein [Gammaproteobacteria bacterium]